MEAFLMWVAISCLGIAFLFIVIALLTKPYRMKKQKQREMERKAKKLTEIYGRVTISRLKIAELAETTERLEKARKNKTALK